MTLKSTESNLAATSSHQSAIKYFNTVIASLGNDLKDLSKRRDQLFANLINRIPNNKINRDVFGNVTGLDSIEGIKELQEYIDYHEFLDKEYNPKLAEYQRAFSLYWQMEYAESMESLGRIILTVTAGVVLLIGLNTYVNFDLIKEKFTQGIEQIKAIPDSLSSIRKS